MDPKSPLARALFSPEIPCSILNEWIEKGHSYRWSKTKEEIFAKMWEKGERLTYLEIKEVFKWASTHKMIGGANAGFSYVLDELKKIVKNA